MVIPPCPLSLLPLAEEHVEYVVGEGDAEVAYVLAATARATVEAHHRLREEELGEAQRNFATCKAELDRTCDLAKGIAGERNHLAEVLVHVRAGLRSKTPDLVAMRLYLDRELPPNLDDVI